MTSFVIVFEILFLILIASPHSIGRAAYLQSSQLGGSRDYMSGGGDVREVTPPESRDERPPGDWRAESQENRMPNHTQQRARNIYKHSQLNAPHPRGEEVVIIYPQNAKGFQRQHTISTNQEARQAGVNRPRARTRRSARHRYEDGNEVTPTSSEPALVDSSNGLTSSATSLPFDQKSTTQDATSYTITSSRATPAAAADDIQSSAELCYLASGGSSLTLTVNEATPVGSLIGTIDVSRETIQTCESNALASARMIRQSCG